MLYFNMGVRHGIIVVCHNLSSGIYTTLVSLVFGTAIPTSFSILMFLHLYNNAVRMALDRWVN